MKKKISTMALVAVLATAAATTPVYASIQYPDINGHWSKNIVEKWAEANVVSGYPDGTFSQMTTLHEQSLVSGYINSLAISLAARTQNLPM